MLRTHRLEQNQRRLLVVAAWQDVDVLLDAGDGAAIDPDTVLRRSTRLTQRLGLEGVRFHDMRHAYATTLLAAGVHPKVASEALGHSNVAFTMDTYPHLLPGLGDQAAEAIDR